MVDHKTMEMPVLNASRGAKRKKPPGDDDEWDDSSGSDGESGAEDTTSPSINSRPARKSIRTKPPVEYDDDKPSVTTVDTIIDHRKASTAGSVVQLLVKWVEHEEAIWVEEHVLRMKALESVQAYYKGLEAAEAAQSKQEVKEVAEPAEPAGHAEQAADVAESAEPMEQAVRRAPPTIPELQASVGKLIVYLYIEGEDQQQEGRAYAIVGQLTKVVLENDVWWLDTLDYVCDKDQHFPASLKDGSWRPKTKKTDSGWLDTGDTFVVCILNGLTNKQKKLTSKDAKDAIEILQDYEDEHLHAKDFISRLRHIRPAKASRI